MATQRARVRVRMPETDAAPTQTRPVKPKLLPGERAIRHNYAGVTILAIPSRYNLFEHVTITTPVTTMRTTVEGRLTDYDPRLPSLLRGLVGISPMQRQRPPRSNGQRKRRG